MPFYDLRCDDGHEFERYLRYADLEHDQVCECGRPAIRLIRAPMVFVQQDICYTSPIDGRPITNKQMRDDDLRRHGCVEYDPGMRQDADRKRQDMDKALDQQVDETVEREFSTMPSRKLEKLQTELLAGASAEVVRQTPRSE